MTKPVLRAESLRKTTAKDYLIRFVFGGAVTVIAGLVAERFGPTVGGAFLAFPAILPASLTFVREHAGKPAAIDDAKGATLATSGLAAFAIVLLTTSELSCGWALALAGAAWLVVSVAIWTIAFGLHERKG
ncbi:MAG TPA: DUF3147 family protein [Polyangiaceae bacterium]